MNPDKRRKPRRSTQVLIFLALIVINSLLARFGVIAYEVGPGVSSFYLSVAFMIAFALWFGAWGAISAYIGCVLGAGFGFVPFGVNLYWSLADLWQVLIPLVAFKRFGADVGLRRKKDFLVFMAFGWILNNIIGAAWGTCMLAVGGAAPWSDVSDMFMGWLIGNLIVTITITPLLLKYVTPRIQRAGILMERYWS